jgi:hypothetical protein
MKSVFIIIGTTLIFLFFIACNTDKKKEIGVISRDGHTEISLGDDIKIIIPTLGEKFDSCKHYTNIEVWKGNEKVYQDTTTNEYKFLCNSSYTKARKLNNDRYEILIEKFDGPDIDKLLAIYLKNDKYESEKLLPFFEDTPEDIDSDGKNEYYGIMNTVDGYGSGDSCYYNPTLYYEVTDNGILLDTPLTKKK